MKKTSLTLLGYIGFMLSCNLFAALSVPIHLNVEATSGTSDSNAGMFDSTIAGGTNYTLSTNLGASCAAHVNIENSTITATITTTAITFTGGYTASSTDVGNFINIISSTGGTPPTLKRYKISAVPDTTHWTLAVTSGASAATITSAFMGGCLPLDSSTISAAVSVPAGIDAIIDLKKGNYTPAALTWGDTTGGAGGQNFQVIGYNLVPGDNPATSANYPVISTTGSSITGHNLSSSASYWNFKYITFDGTSCTTLCTGMQWNSVSASLQQVKFSNWLGVCIFQNAGGMVVDSVEFNNCQSAGSSSVILQQNNNTQGTIVRNSYFHANVGTSTRALLATNTVSFDHNVVICANSNKGILASVAASGSIEFNIFDSCGSALDLSAGSNGSGLGNTLYIKNNILSNNTTAIVGVANYTAQNGENCNGFYNNGTNFTNWTAGAADVLLTASPYTNYASNIFTLNSSSGGGLALRNAGCPTSFPVLSGTSAPDIGAFQSTAGSAAFPIIVKY